MSSVLGQCDVVMPLDTYHGDLSSAVITYVPRILSVHKGRKKNKQGTEEETGAGRSRGTRGIICFPGSICVAGSNQRPGLASGTRLPEGLAEGSLVACRLP